MHGPSGWLWKQYLITTQACHSDTSMWSCMRGTWKGFSVFYRVQNIWTWPTVRSGGGPLLTPGEEGGLLSENNSPPAWNAEIADEENIIQNSPTDSQEQPQLAESSLQRRSNIRSKEAKCGGQKSKHSCIELIEASWMQFASNAARDLCAH